MNFKDRAVGKDAGKDLGFIESLTDVAQKREIQFEEYWPTVVREKAEFYKPTEQLILIDPKTNLPPRGPIMNGTLITFFQCLNLIFREFTRISSCFGS